MPPLEATWTGAPTAARDIRYRQPKITPDRRTARGGDDPNEAGPRTAAGTPCQEGQPVAGPQDGAATADKPALPTSPLPIIWGSTCRSSHTGPP
jgi:hypothetical protein